MIRILFLFIGCLAHTETVVLITGASRGIGKAIAFHLSEQPGYRVYAGVRTLPKEPWPERVQCKILDVTDENNCHRVAQEILSEAGRIDVLINNAGQGLYGPAETVTIDEAKALFEVNFFGALRMIQAVLPTMRRQNQGRIINMSSMVGIRAGICWDLYCSSKFALEGLSESLASSLAHWNVFVTIVEPGHVATEFAHESTVLGTRLKGMENPYQGLIRNAFERMKKNVSRGQAPQEIAVFIQNLLETKQPNVRYQITPEDQLAASQKFVDITGMQAMRQVQQIIETLWSIEQN